MGRAGHGRGRLGCGRGWAWAEPGVDGAWVGVDTTRGTRGARWTRPLGACLYRPQKHHSSCLSAAVVPSHCAPEHEQDLVLIPDACRAGGRRVLSQPPLLLRSYSIPRNSAGQALSPATLTELYILNKDINYILKPMQYRLRTAPSHFLNCIFPAPGLRSVPASPRSTGRSCDTLAAPAGLAHVRAVRVAA